MRAMTRPRVLITGMGLVSSLGRTAEEFGDNLFAGRSAIGPVVGLGTAESRFGLGGQIHDFDFSVEMPDVDMKRLLRYSQFALVAADRALKDGALSLDRVNRHRVGTAFGTAASSTGEGAENDVKRFHARGERGVSPTAWAEHTPCSCTSHVAIHYKFHGPSSTLSSGCVSGSDAIAWGVQQIRDGMADAMVVGGTDTPFFPYTWAMMCRSGILSPTPDDGGSIPRPFSYDHNGIVLAEGGSALLIESESHARLRGAHVYAEITGIANTEEALPMKDLDPSGKAFAVTMRCALQDAGLPPTAIDWVLAHGTGHPIADGSESQGIETALGSHAFCIPVSSIRGAIGQPFASAGGFQVAAACTALFRQYVPPTLNFSRPAEGCRLDYVPNIARKARLRRILINAAGVGGTHSGAVIEAYER